MSIHVTLGLDRAISEAFAQLRGKRVGVLCHQASVSSRGVHILDALLDAARVSDFSVVAAFGPQHGIWGHTQDNMIEWEGYRDARTGVPFYSLYGESRKPKPEWLRDIDTVVIDLVDVGSRYYTFMWTMCHMLQACESAGIGVLVLDRPNPIGRAIKGTVLEPEFASFVGLHPLPTQHGRTLGEIAMHFQRTLFPNLNLAVVLSHADRDWEKFEHTGAFWVMPSPNMPTPETARVYPGGCLIEGTELSEGRGTTRPFEMIGAPYLDGWKLAEPLNKLDLQGVHFRPIVFQPTFHKFATQICEGVFVHVTEPTCFNATLAYVALLQEVIRQAGPAFSWRPPPYEYEERLMPIDILAGNGWLRPAIENLDEISEIEERMQSEVKSFLEQNPDY